MVEDILTYDDLEVDVGRQIVRRGGKGIYFTRKEFSLLEYLIRNKEQVVSRASMVEHVWDMKADIFSNTIESHILSLRKKLSQFGGTKLIHTVPGRGYKLGA